MSNHPILFVDDDLISRLLNCAILRESGFEVLEAGSYAEACRIIQHHRLAAVVTDIDLEDEADGFDVARGARAANAHIPVVYISGGDPGAACQPGRERVAVHSEAVGSLSDCQDARRRRSPCASPTRMSEAAFGLKRPACAFHTNQGHAPPITAAPLMRSSHHQVGDPAPIPDHRGFLKIVGVSVDLYRGTPP